MEFNGRYAIPAPPDVVWAALNDPEILKGCIPGCQSLIKTGDTEFQAAAKLKVGPVNATFKGRVTLTDLDPPRRCILKGEGQGGVAGFAKGQAEVRLEPHDTGTLLSYDAGATVGGKLAQIGQRLLDGAAKQIADDFFARFVTAVAHAGLPAATPAESAPPAAVPSPVATAQESRPGLAPEIWVIGLIAVIVILLVLFGLVL